MAKVRGVSGLAAGVHVPVWLLVSVSALCRAEPSPVQSQLGSGDTFSAQGH